MCQEVSQPNWYPHLISATPSPTGTAPGLYLPPAMASAHNRYHRTHTETWKGPIHRQGEPLASTAPLGQEGHSGQGPAQPPASLKDIRHP